MAEGKMLEKQSPSAQRCIRIALFIVLWALIAWLLYPLLAFDSASLISIRQYFYRAVLGIMMMILVFGKTVVDLFFPIDLSDKRAISYSILLTVYSLLLVGGIIFMIARVILVYLKSSINTDTGVSY
ncbi:MAG TPA: hypothetical protein PLX50_02895 [Candidatus Aminicenantes bacterium]|nr:hypothetical protein [Candidatus Aminicenantes bacterium]